MVNMLNKLKDDVENLNPDRANLIRSYYSKTGIKINLIFSLIELDRYLIDNSNPSLNKKFQAVQSKFIDHLSKKIEFGTNDEEDLLFELKEVALQELEEAVPNLIKDVKKLEQDQDRRKKIIQLLQKKCFSDLFRYLS